MKKIKSNRLKDNTIRRMMNELYSLSDRLGGPKGHTSYMMACALQWSLGGCTWTPLTLLRESDGDDE